MLLEAPHRNAQTIISSLLAWDAFFAWYYPFRESIPFMCPLEQREMRAFDNMTKAIDMVEAFERISINNHKSFLPHIAVYKVRCLPSHVPPRRTVGFGSEMGAAVVSPG